MAAKKSPSDGGLTKLKAALNAGTPGHCYLFYGEETYLRDYYLSELKKLLLTPGLETFNLHTFQGKELTFRELQDAVDAFPMMAEHSMVVVYDYDLYANEERRTQLEGLLSDLPDYLCLVFVYDQTEYKSGGNTRLGKLMKQAALPVEFRPQSQSDLNAWIRRRFKSFGKDIDNPTAEYLTFLCGGLMTGLASEIEKIGFYAPGKNITRADIDAVADPVLDARVFQMTDAITNRNFPQAAAVLSDLYQLNNEPIMILAVLGKHLRQLWSARLYLERRKSQAALAQLWEMRSDWQARKLMDAARRFDLPWCRRAVVLAEETDVAMKSTGLNSEELLVDLLLKLAVN
ncbi:MAG: DNA polymerase III subunit delta [Clostridiales bacterium]|nr:DNA polymerase III subunit delta [Clostridiales bacterium]